MNNPLVSIITPSHNASFLRETIDSVLEQTYQNWEMLIVDDGSIDDTLLVAKSYAEKDKRVKVFSLGYNSGGPATPRNFGMRKAQGSYIAFLDCDDIWLEEKLQKQVDFMEKNRDVFLSYCQCIVERDGKQLSIAPPNPKAGNIFNDLLYGNLIDCLGVIMRNRKEENTYFFDEDKRLVAVEDYAMWIEISHKEKIGFLKEPLGVYRMHSKGISTGAFSNFRKCGFVLRKFTHLVSPVTRLKVYINFYTKLVFVGIMITLINIKNSIVKRGISTNK